MALLSFYAKCRQAAALPLELSSGSLATRRRLAPSWPCRVLLLAVAVLRTVRHVLRIGQDVRSTLRRLQHRRRRSSTHSVTLV